MSDAPLVRSRSLPESSATDAAAPGTRWSGRITVSCRMRPLLANELVAGMKQAPWLLSDRTIALGRRSSGRPATAPASGRELGDKTETKTVMDAVFGQRATTREVYECAFREIVSGAADCLNGAILAYGQTASGKTYSMSGSSTRGIDEEASSPAQKGIIHYALDDLFSQIFERSRAAGRERNEISYSVRMSYCEIYMERVNDLLRENWTQSQDLAVREDRESRSFYVEGLREKTVTSAKDVLALLSQAERRRRVACTQYNELSSRSHAVLTLVIECSSPLVASSDNMLEFGDVPSVTRVGRLAFVDLAGNERVEASTEYLAESNSINKSLFFLGKVIETLAAAERRGSEEVVRPEYLPVRDSNLTRLLAGHLGGNSRTGLLVTLTPSHENVEEGLATLRFAQKAATIRCNAQPAFLSKDQLFIIRQQKTITQLREDLREAQDKLATGTDHEKSLASTSNPHSGSARLFEIDSGCADVVPSEGRVSSVLRQECSRARAIRDPTVSPRTNVEIEPIVERTTERPRASLGTPDFLRLARLDDVCLRRPAALDMAGPSPQMDHSEEETHVHPASGRAKLASTWTPGQPRDAKPQRAPHLSQVRSVPSGRMGFNATAPVPQSRLAQIYTQPRSESPSVAPRGLRSEVGRQAKHSQRRSASVSRLGVRKAGMNHTNAW